MKRLFTLSGNICAFPKCTTSLIDEESGSVTAQICHIKGKNAGSARFDLSQINEERDAFENLILMCAYHHKVIDDDEESYSVERLQRIKADHENRHREDVEKRKLEKLGEQLFSETGRNTLNSEPPATLEEANSSLIMAQKLAEKTRHNERRREWKYSQDGMTDTVNSINEIYSLINRRITEYADTYRTLGIELTNRERTVLCISDTKFGSQIELEGFTGNSYSNTAANITLKLWSFKKKHSYQTNAGLSCEDVKRIWLKPDIVLDGQVIWTDKEGILKPLTGEGVCEKLFSLLQDRINESPRLDETIPGGKYFVDGQFVNANGEIIDDEDDYNIYDNNNR